MSAENLTVQEALEVLVNRVERYSPDIGRQIREAVNEGHTISRNNDFLEQNFEEVASYSYEEALEVALTVLRAYLVEVPAFLHSAQEEFARASAVESNSLYSNVPENSSPEKLVKKLTIDYSDLNRTTVLRDESESQAENFVMPLIEQEDLNQQMERYEALQRLIHNIGE